MTGDKNLTYQQNLEGRTMGVVVLLPTINWTVLKRTSGNAFGYRGGGGSGGAGIFEELPHEESSRRTPRRSGPQP